MGPIEVKPDRWQMATAIASLLSVLAVGVGLIVTNNYNRAQQDLTLQGQITDRFTKAVEQLGQSGPEKIDVRLGAIYALQRIIRDSADDQPAVVDILSAFVRVHAPALGRAADGSFTGKPAPRPVDIQAALTVLARRSPDRDGEGRVDLSQTNLSRADLRGAYLFSADLVGADLRGADLVDANLFGASLVGADLRDASLFDTNLEEANLSDADLREAYLSATDLIGADLVGADLRGASLFSADLRGASLVGADLSGAYLRGADLDPDQLRCTYVDEDTVLPVEIARPIPKAPTADPQCKLGD